MKKLLIILSFLPLTAIAQDNDNMYRNELGPSVGVSFFMPKGVGVAPRPMLALNYLRNIRQYQLGLIVEGAVLNSNYVYVIPALVANRKFGQNRSYFYGGLAMGGFVGRNKVFNENQPGVMLGIQGGYVLSINNHLCFASQVAVRAIYTWTNGAYQNTGEVVPHVPVTIGLRYRF